MRSTDWAARRVPNGAIALPSSATFAKRLSAFFSRQRSIAAFSPGGTSARATSTEGGGVAKMTPTSSGIVLAVNGNAPVSIS